MSSLAETAVMLAAVVITVPIARRLGLGAVLGYLAAGVAIGPAGFDFVTGADALLHAAEFGIVLLLFIIGLELQPSRLWTMRHAVFGFGLAQVVITGGALALIARFAGFDVAAASLIGLALSLSSTAFALQTLAEKQQLTTRHGRLAFATLLFQDLVAIPLIALVPLLGGQASGPMGTTGLLAGAEKLVLLALLMVAGRYPLRLAFRLVTRARVQEVFTAAALLTVIGTALLMTAAGFSAALGAFVAGVLLADCEYRHALQADLEPFKGLLLGLFFLAVGMSLNVAMIAAEPFAIALLVGALVVVKVAVLYPLARMAELPKAGAWRLAGVLSQGGEFAFVIFTAAAAAAVLPVEQRDRLIVVITLSMVTTPFLLGLIEAVARRHRVDAGPREPPPGDEHQVIIAGFGRVGQIVARVLRAKRIAFTALDASPEQADFVARYGNKIYYGDASRLELLTAAGADKAVVFVLAIDDVEASVRTAETVVRHFPHLKIYARARNRQHAYRLMELGVAAIWRETLLSSIELTRAVLTGLGLPDYEAERACRTFRSHDEQQLATTFGRHRDDAELRALARKSAEELEELFAQDAAGDAERNGR